MARENDGAMSPSPAPTEPPPSGEHAEPTPAQLGAGANTFALLASPVRLHLVWLITHASPGCPYDVGTLARRVGISIATASQHLSKLRLAGLISAHRDGRRQLYTVDDPHVITLIQQIFDHIAPDGTLAPDPPRRTGEEPAGGGGVPPLGQQHVDDLPVLVDRPEQVPLPARRP
jgi:DNA-binding transcriptional ArsR family regulator